MTAITETHTITRETSTDVSRWEIARCSCGSTSPETVKAGVTRWINRHLKDAGA